MEVREINSFKIAVYNFDVVEKPRAVMLLVHGLGEHAGRYKEWAGRFNSAGIAMRSFDLPGHGYSEGKRGVVPDFEKLYKIIRILVEEVKNDFEGVPVILYGHSLGGLVLEFLIKNNCEINGAIVTSPWIRLAFEPPQYKVLIARVLNKVVPDLLQKTGLNPEHMSHDPAAVAAYRNDPLIHYFMSARFFVSMTEAAEEILRKASYIKVPLLLVHGRDDMITSPSGTIDVASAAPHATLKLWDGGYHELHNDTMKDEHFEFILEWIENII